MVPRALKHVVPRALCKY